MGFNGRLAPEPEVGFRPQSGLRFASLLELRSNEVMPHRHADEEDHKQSQREHQQ